MLPYLLGAGGAGGAGGGLKCLGGAQLVLSIANTEVSNTILVILFFITVSFLTYNKSETVIVC
jgi:hypothetical protein